MAGSFSSACRQIASSPGVSSREIVQQYLARIDRYEDTLHATLAVNADALLQH